MIGGAVGDVPTPIVDAHMHLWDLSLGKHPWLCGAPIPFRYGDYAPIRRTYLEPDYRSDAGPIEVAAAVYVETEWDPADPVGETRWVHEYARENALPSAVVAQAWLDREDAPEVLAAQAAFPLVRSVRHKPAATRTPGEAVRGARGSMDDPQWRSGFAHLERYDLHFDLQTPWWHLDAAADLARDFPRTTLVLNHTGLPSDRSAEGLAAWRAAMDRLAAELNVSVKISGIGVAGAPWDGERNAIVVRETITMFGSERCLFASNFPVDSLTGDFATIFAGFSRMTADLSDSARRALFRDNAAALYRIALDEGAQQPNEMTEERL